jgi:alpha-glucosidase
LSIGSYASIHVQEHIFGYERRYSNERLTILLNLGHQSERVPLPDDAGGGQILLSTYLDRDGERVESAVRVRADEGIIIKLEAT